MRPVYPRQMLLKQVAWQKSWPVTVQTYCANYCKTATTCFKLLDSWLWEKDSHLLETLHSQLTEVTSIMNWMAIKLHDQFISNLKLTETVAVMLLCEARCDLYRVIWLEFHCNTMDILILYCFMVKLMNEWMNEWMNAKLVKFLFSFVWFIHCTCYMLQPACWNVLTCV